MINTNVKNIIIGIDKENSEYILKDQRVRSRIESLEWYAKNDNRKMAEYMVQEIEELAKDFGEKILTPANAKVGEGVTMHLYSDSHAGTIVKVTKATITVQRDNAIIDPNFKPKFIPGGFAGHCTNQNEQKYTYEQNPNAEMITFRWSNKYGMYRNDKIGMKVTKGRKEFYDYNY